MYLGLGGAIGDANFSKEGKSFLLQKPDIFEYDLNDVLSLDGLLISRDQIRSAELVVACDGVSDLLGRKGSLHVDYLLSSKPKNGTIDHDSSHKNYDYEFVSNPSKPLSKGGYKFDLAYLKRAFDRNFLEKPSEDRGRFRIRNLKHVNPRFLL